MDTTGLSAHEQMKLYATMRIPVEAALVNHVGDIVSHYKPVCLALLDKSPDGVTFASELSFELSTPGPQRVYACRLRIPRSEVSIDVSLNNAPLDAQINHRLIIQDLETSEELNGTG